MEQLMASPIHSVIDLTRGVLNKAHEKFDLYLTHNLLDESYAAKFLDLSGAYSVVGELVNVPPS